MGLLLRGGEEKGREEEGKGVDGKGKGPGPKYFGLEQPLISICNQAQAGQLNSASCLVFLRGRYRVNCQFC